MLRERRVADLTRVHYWRSGSAGSRLRPEHVRAALDAGTRILHLTGITCALGAGPLATVRAAAEHAVQQGWTVTLDVNHRSRLGDAETAAAALRPLLPLVDVLIASDDELPLVADESGDAERAAELLAAGVREVVVKRGAEGADLYLARATPLDLPARPVPVVDTVGAGDAFSAGCLSGLLDGLDPRQRLQRAIRTAAFAVVSTGDWEGLPHRDELPLLDTAPGGALR